MNLPFASAAPAELGSFINVLAVLLGIIGAAFAIYFGFRKSRVEIEPQPMEVRSSPKRFNHALAETRHTEHERRLDAHDKEIVSLWTIIRLDMPAMERRINDAGEARIGKVHDRINEILGEVRELAGKMEKK